MDKNLEVKLDRNFEIYSKILDIMGSAHTKPSPETLKAIKELSEQMEKISLILEKVISMLEKNKLSI